MSLLFLIPARGGSKRVPGKNIRELGGQPLISWTIDLAKRVGFVLAVIIAGGFSLVPIFVLAGVITTTS
jgi:CMP-N-acetylneuraminic acid synthetase